MFKFNAKLVVYLGMAVILGNISVCFTQSLVPDLKTLGQLVRQNFEGYTTSNTRQYTLVGNGNPQMFPLDKNGGFPLPSNVAGPVRTVVTGSPSGYPYNYQQVKTDNPGWQPSNVNPYSYMLGRQSHQGRADFSQEDAGGEGDIITVEDLQDDAESDSLSREIQIQSSMSF